MFNSRSYAIRLKHNFSFHARYKLFFVSFLFYVEEFLRSISMRELEYDIDVYVRLDLLVTIVKKVTLKIGEVFLFLILTQWSISSKSPRFRIDRTYDTY